MSPGYSLWFRLRLIAKNTVSGPWPQTNRHTLLKDICSGVFTGRGGGHRDMLPLGRRNRLHEQKAPWSAGCVFCTKRHFSECVLIHEIGTILPHKTPTIAGAPPDENVIIYIRRFNVFEGAIGLDNDALLRLVLPLGGFLNTPLVVYICLSARARGFYFASVWLLWKKRKCACCFWDSRYYLGTASFLDIC